MYLFVAWAYLFDAIAWTRLARKHLVLEVIWWLLQRDLPSSRKSFRTFSLLSPSTAYSHPRLLNLTNRIPTTINSWERRQKEWGGKISMPTTHRLDWSDGIDDSSLSEAYEIGMRGEFIAIMSALGTSTTDIETIIELFWLYRQHYHQ